MDNFLVTGGAGFIGSHIVEALVKRGSRVRVLDNFTTGKKENIAPFLERIELIEGDIREFETCRKAVQGVDYVLHQAALPSVPRSLKDPILVNEVNVTGTLNLLWASHSAKVRRLVFASSSSVYGDTQKLPQQEGREGRPLSPYALSKLIGEKYCQLFYKVYGLETISLRYFNIFGPRQDPSSQYAAVIPLFVTRIFSGERPRIFGDGEQSRDFTYVENAMEANLRAAEAPAAALGGAFNIACGEPTTVNAVVDEINRFAGTSIESIHVDPRPGDIRHSFADIGRARSILRFDPKIRFRVGLETTVAWYRGRSTDEPRI
jgi:nucleoside-diphosphate-sugar epimerase